MKNKTLSIVVPTYGKIQFTKQCLDNIRQVAPKWTEFIFVDDGSTDWTVEFLSKQKDIIFIDNKVNKWVTYSWNLWVDIAKWDYICVINNDVIFPKEFFEKLMEWLEENWKALFSVPRWTNGRDPSNPSQVKYYKNHLCWFVYMLRWEDKTKWVFPLEPRLRVFGSDNRAYHKTKEYNLNICTVTDAICHHYESITSKAEENSDTKMFQDICKEEWWNIVETIFWYDSPKTKYVLI